MNKKILISVSVIALAAAVVVGGTVAFFSDTETSTGNTFTAGAIDLGIDNESFLNGQPNALTTWELAFDLGDGGGPSGGAYLFFNFDDLKPGDYGEDTISIRVNDNDAWICSETTVRTDKDNSCTEPEKDAEGAGVCGFGDPNSNGDLADEIQIMWWADDGDNVFERDEIILDQGNLGQAPLGSGIVRALADKNNNIWTGNSNDPATGAKTLHIAKAWCFGTINPLSFRNTIDSDTPPSDPANAGVTTVTTPEDGGFTCTGASVISNASQSDSVTLDVEFTAVQSRNNANFICGN